MQRFRVSLFCVLAMAIPIQGFAHAALRLSPCPMEQLKVQDASTVTPTPDLAAMDDMSMHDCCPDADAAEPTDQTCKPGQPCQMLGSLFPVSAHLLLSQSPDSAARFAHPADVAFSFEPAATWRPPALD